VRGKIYPTLEVFVSDYRTRLTRGRDAGTGLWLLQLTQPQ
jgi:predicted DNA-binding protein with PD1-like motif